MTALKVTQWSHEDKEHSVPYYTRHISQQHGAIRFVTENSLQEELLRHGSTEDHQNEPSDLHNDKDRGTKSSDHIRSLRYSLLENLHNAHSQSVLGSDLLSLLLARNDADTASKSISPTVRDLIPLGSVTSEPRRIGLPSDRQERLERLRAGGLELEAFESTVDSVIAAAERLEKTVRQETVYWQEIARTEEQGWLISRPTRDRKFFRARIGSGESGPTYNNKSLVGVISSPDGKVKLDLSRDISRGRKLRVSLYSKGLILASHSTLSPEKSDVTSLAEQLSEARDSLFDEELFHEISREASRLWNKGIKFTDKGIAIPFGRDVEAVVDLDGGESRLATESTHHSTIGKESNWYWTESIAISLRILMSRSHRLRRQKRAGIPLGLAARQYTGSDTDILMPLASQMANYTASKTVGLFVQDICQLLARAQVETSSSSQASVTRMQDIASREQIHPASTSELLTEMLSNPLPSSFDLDFPSISVRLCVMFRVHGGSCEYRYLISNHSADSLLAQLPADMVFQTVEEVIEAAIDICRICLVSTIQKATHNAWQSTVPQTGEMQAKRDGVHGSIRTLRLALSQWALLAEISESDVLDSEPTTVWSIDRESDETVDLINELKKVLQ